MRKIKKWLLKTGVAMTLAASILGGTITANAADTAIIAEGSEQHPNHWDTYEEFTTGSVNAQQKNKTYKSWKYTCYRMIHSEKYDTWGKSYTTLKDCWAKIDGKWYFFSSTGYYFSKCGGRMCKSEYIEGYWLNPNGTWTYKHRASWKHNKQGWWYGDDTGWYARNQWLRIDNEWYYFNAKGYAVTGWQKLGGYWYYFRKNCAMEHSGFVTMTDPTGKERTLYFFGDGTWQ